MMTALPDPLHTKLGASAAEGLVFYVHSVQKTHDGQLLEVIENRMTAKILQSEDRTRKDIQHLEHKLEKRFDSIDKRFDRADKRSDAVENRIDRLDSKFDRLQETMLNLHKQMGIQTRWIVTAGGVIASVFKLLDIFVK